MWPEPGDPGNGWPAATLAWLHALGLPRAVDMVVLEAAANVVMFVPVGVLLVLATRLRPTAAVAAGAAFSALIELTQLLLLPHRVATVQDVVMNSLGALLGVTLAVTVRARRATSSDDGASDDGASPDGASPDSD